MSEKPEALRLADWHESVRLVGVEEECWKAAAELRRQHAKIERLREALAWAYNLRHLRGHSDPVVIPERFAPLIEDALRRERT